MFFKWKEEYEVGIVEIDQQHRLLVNLINDLYMSIHENKSTEVMAEFLSRLKMYTLIHFDTEREIMRKSNYSGLDDHLLQHDEMIVKLAEVETKYARGRLGLAAELIVFLRKWLVEHICESDKVMASSINRGG